MKTTFEENHIKVLEWPGNSPSLNAIENLWSRPRVKIRLLKRDCTSKTKLSDAIIDMWYCNLKITRRINANTSYEVNYKEVTISN